MELITSKEFEVGIQKRRVAGESGFTLIEAICAVAVLTIGLIGTAAAITTAWKYQQISRNVTEAKSIILAQIEEIHSLRDSRRLNYRQIENVSNLPTLPANIAKVKFTGFPDGWQSVYDKPGKDGVFGTADDQAGADGTVGNADDGIARAGFRRRIDITAPALPDTNIKLINVTVEYPGPDGKVFTLNCVSFLNNDFKQ